jgi:hypothetical protein
MEYIEDCRLAKKAVSLNPLTKFDNTSIEYYSQRVEDLKDYLRGKLSSAELENIERGEAHYLKELNRKADFDPEKLPEYKKTYHELLYSFLIEFADKHKLLEEEVPREKLEETKGELPP